MTMRGDREVTEQLCEKTAEWRDSHARRRQDKVVQEDGDVKETARQGEKKAKRISKRVMHGDVEQRWDLKRQLGGF